MKRQGNWAPSPNDAMAMAAIRWFACVIESYAIELYATNPTTFAHTEAVLRDAIRKLALAKLKIKQEFNAEDDCPEGYRMCDGICKPSCEEEAPAAPDVLSAKKPRKPTKR